MNNPSTAMSAWCTLFSLRFRRVPSYSGDTVAIEFKITLFGEERDVCILHIPRIGNPADYVRIGVRPDRPVEVFPYFDDVELTDGSEPDP